MLLTIHQPSPSIYDLFDRIIMLHYGRVCYFGDGFSSPIAFFAQQARPATVYCTPTHPSSRRRTRAAPETPLVLFLGGAGICITVPYAISPLSRVS